MLDENPVFFCLKQHFVLICIQKKTGKNHLTRFQSYTIISPINLQEAEPDQPLKAKNSLEEFQNLVKKLKQNRPFQLKKVVNNDIVLSSRGCGYIHGKILLYRQSRMPQTRRFNIVMTRKVTASENLRRFRPVTRSILSSRYMSVLRCM